MTKENRIKIVTQKLRMLEGKGDLDKRQGILRKLRRELRNLEK